MFIFPKLKKNQYWPWLHKNLTFDLYASFDKSNGINTNQNYSVWPKLKVGDAKEKLIKYSSPTPYELVSTILNIYTT